MLKRFDKHTQMLLTEYNAKSPNNCKLLVCFATLQAILNDGERYFPESFQIVGSQLTGGLENGSLDVICAPNNITANETSGESFSNAVMNEKSPQESSTLFEAESVSDVMSIGNDIATVTEKPIGVKSKGTNSTVSKDNGNEYVDPDGHNTGQDGLVEPHGFVEVHSVDSKQFAENVGAKTNPNSVIGNNGTVGRRPIAEHDGSQFDQSTDSKTLISGGDNIMSSQQNGN